MYEFVCDAAVPAGEVGTFEVVAINCQYERKYRKSSESARERDLQQFNFHEQPIPSASPISSPTAKSSPDSLTSRPKSEPPDSATKPKVDSPEGISKAMSRSTKSRAPVTRSTPTVAPPVAAHPEAKAVYVKTRAELHLFDFDSQTFILQDPAVIATVSEVGTWQYWLQISSDTKDWLGQAVGADLNPVFNFEFLSFIFNHYAGNGDAYSWLLRFPTQEAEEQFQEGLMQALWEHLNEMRWVKAKDDERDYVLEAFNDLKMEDAPTDEDGQDEDEEFEVVENDDAAAAAAPRSEHYDSDESADDVVAQPASQDGTVNSQLAVGYAHDRSYVVRGSKIGVFKHTPNNALEFSTNISKVVGTDGKTFSPKKVMLHAEDTNMVLQNEKNPNSLYRMDLEYGKVVDEWKVHDDIPVDSFAPDKVGCKHTGISFLI